MAEPNVINWIHVQRGLPDAEITVLMAHGDREVREGFLDGTDDNGLPVWRDVTALQVQDVYAWADMPEGPAR